jgi:hypothetical protein
MIQVDRRLLAWVVSVGVVLVGGALAVREFWPGLASGVLGGGGGLGAISVGVPSLIALPILIANLVLSVMARRRGGRAASIGSVCLAGIAVLALFTLAVSLTPPAVMAYANSVFVMVLLILLAFGASLPIQTIVLAILTFVVIGSPRVPRSAG